VTEISFDDLVTGLRSWARGCTAHEQAAVELLIWHETWLRRPDFRGAAISQRAPGLVAIINWYEAREFIGRGYQGREGRMLPASSSQRRILDLTVALGEDMFGLAHLGHAHRWHAAAAFAAACGHTLEGPILQPGQNHPDVVPGRPKTCGPAPHRPRDDGRCGPGGVDGAR